LCSNLAEGLREHHLQPGVGHYGVFNGSRFRAEIAPKIRDFTAKHQRRWGVLAWAYRRSA
jgi:poly(3-hydroxybutyrate) depolymerase